MDIVATISCLLDVSSIINAVMPDDPPILTNTADTGAAGGQGGAAATQAGSLARTTKSSKAGTKTSKMIRLIRLTRLLRIMKLYKEAQRLKREEDEEFGTKSKKDKAMKELLNRPSAALECDWMNPEELNEGEEEGFKESRVGKKLSDLTTRKVIILVLTMLLLIPLFNIEFWIVYNPLSQQTGLN